MKKCTSILCLLLMIISLCPIGAYAVEQQETPDYKVAFYAFDCYHMQDENGKRSGYGYEMMQGLSKYLQSTFSYVGYDKSAAECVEMLRSGELDIYTAAKKTPEREKEFVFSTHPAITSSTCMNVKVCQAHLRGLYTCRGQQSIKDTGHGTGYVRCKGLYRAYGRNAVYQKRAWKRLRIYHPIKEDENSRPEFVGKKILLVEDNALNAEIAMDLLHTIGLQVDRAENGEIGLEKFQASEHDEYFAVFMDMQMPVMDGVTATKRIRQSSRTDHDIPIFAMTANTFANDRRNCNEAGMNGYIPKPVSVKDIESALNVIE